ncbi:MAG: hypothetical protein OSJ74_01790, partial [Clostridia bacterium]|nr:hypothetical protein [Clostridia bacterium]
YFSLMTFFIYYLNFMLRIGMRCSSYFKQQGISSFTAWFAVVTDPIGFKQMSDEIFDWYTITLLVFLFLYSIVFLITFIRFSPKHKKTFKYFKKGFLMARRVIKLISVGLTLTVLINSAQLATFSDKFMFIISLLSILYTFMQIIISLTSWIIGKKLNRSVRQYVGNVMSNYIAASRIRPRNYESEKGKATVGDRLSKAKERFLRTIETLTLTNDEAMQRAAELESYVIDTNSVTERFENDYQENGNQVVEEFEEKKKSKKSKKNVTKTKRLSKTGKERSTSKVSSKQNKSQKSNISEEVASDLADKKEDSGKRK